MPLVGINNKFYILMDLYCISNECGIDDSVFHVFVFVILIAVRVQFSKTNTCHHYFVPSTSPDHFCVNRRLMVKTVTVL